MYVLFLTEHAKKFLKKIPKSDAAIILRKLQSLEQDPFPHLKKLQGNMLWRLRIMDFRAIIDVAVTEKTIVVIRIGHRKNVYD